MECCSTLFSVIARKYDEAISILIAMTLNKFDSRSNGNAEQNHTTFYVGVTSELYPRIVDHREKRYPKSFSTRYNLNKLVYYEAYHSIEEAISREHQIKGGSRQKKIDLINQANPNWDDLFNEISNW